MHNQQFEVSVVIPVYNAEKYVVRAINSALEQAEVKEVIVVDDGYADNAYELCQQIAEKEPRVKLFTHPKHENLGAAVSRNLGMLNASCDYIAFLDADDYFLPNRFRFTKETFASDNKIEGVYEPVIFDIKSDYGLGKLRKIKSAKFESDGLNYENNLSYPVNPHSGINLFHSLIDGGNDGPHTDGITIKKSLIAKAGVFNPLLELHQDVEYWMRLSFFGFLSPTLNHTCAVSVREMHDENRTYNQNIPSKLRLWRSVLGWVSQLEMGGELFKKTMERYQSLISQSHGVK